MVRSHGARSGRGFTLLEVMVAVAILGLGLITILTAQTGLFSSAKRAARLSAAVGLARCKMSEVEEQLLREGFQLTRQDESGPCCVDEESDLRCEWSIIPVTLPDLSSAAAAGPDAGAEQSPTAQLDVLSEAKDEIAQGETGDALTTLGQANPAALEGAGPSAGAGALAPLAMSLIYPQLKAMLEASIRKVVVRVVWSEGPIERDMSVTQYITNPQQGGLLALDEGVMAGQAGAGSLPGMNPGGAR